MCIIVVKEKDKKTPSIETLKTCFKNNPDGAGFMYTYKGKVLIDKGYMTSDAFIKRYEELKKAFNDFEGKSLVIHFRIGTAGTNSAQNTHPYPISDNVEELHKLKTTCKLGLAHNGIISDYNPSKSDNADDLNDTQIFIKEYMTLMQKYEPTFYKNDKHKKAIKSIISTSRLAILDTSDEITLIGNFIEDADGIKYSNDTYKEKTYKSYYSSNYSSTYYPNYYDDYDWNWWSKKTNTSKTQTSKNENKKADTPKTQKKRIEPSPSGVLIDLFKTDIVKNEDGTRWTIPSDDLYYYDKYQKAIYKLKQIKTGVTCYDVNGRQITGV